MKHTVWIASALALAALASSAAAPADEAPGPRAMVLRAQRMLDVRSGAIVRDAAIRVDGDRIAAAGPAAEVLSGAAALPVLDLGAVTLLPGLIDCHTHLLARVPDGPGGYALALATKSEAQRALEGAANARATLQAGFTTVRDVGNEGSNYADLALRDAIASGLVDGPRMRVATRAIAVVGQYLPFGIAPGLSAFPHGAQMVSGVEEARRAAREQIGHGADLLKVYADWDAPTLTVAELQIVVEEAHKAGRKVAAHAETRQGIANAVAAGVDSIEHGSGVDRETLQLMKFQGVVLVPTLSVMDAWAAQSPANMANPKLQKRLDAARQSVEAARALGVKIALGSDPSTADRHGRNAEEALALARRGLGNLDAIRAATSTAAELIGLQDEIGTLEGGKVADIIAVPGDPLEDLTALLRVAFVMQGGRIVRGAQPQRAPRRPPNRTGRRSGASRQTATVGRA